MSYKEAIQNALEKMPDAKELWMHPEDKVQIDKEDSSFLPGLSVTVGDHYALPKGAFYLTSLTLEELFKSNL